MTLPRATGPSPHLTWYDVSCRDGTPYPMDWRETRLVTLCEEFEAIRALCGSPLLVNSGFRSRAYNTRIGGAPNSQHCEGRALDLVPVRCSLDDLYAAVMERTRVGKARGVGRYSGFIHFDIRPGDHIAKWGIEG